jgi:hypothetical protein
MCGRLNIHPICFRGTGLVLSLYFQCALITYISVLIAEILRQLLGIKIPKWNQKINLILHFPYKKSSTLRRFPQPLVPWKTSFQGNFASVSEDVDHCCGCLKDYCAKLNCCKSHSHIFGITRLAYKTLMKDDYNFLGRVISVHAFILCEYEVTLPPFFDYLYWFTQSRAQKFGELKFWGLKLCLLSKLICYIYSMLLRIHKR